MQNISINQVQKAAAFPALFRKVYLWMTLGLTMTALSALITAKANLFYVMGNGIWLFFIAELALVWILSSRIMKLSFSTAALMFAAFAILNGVTLSSIFMIYTMSSIVSTFFITAGTFGAMSIIGAVTKKDLSSYGRILFMALIGLIIATVVNIFWANSLFDWIISFVGVILFCGLTAYDTQMIKKMFLVAGDEVNDNTMKIALLGSLSLYLDFINLFLYLLRLLGNSRN